MDIITIETKKGHYEITIGSKVYDINLNLPIVGALALALDMYEEEIEYEDE